MDPETFEDSPQRAKRRVRRSEITLQDILVSLRRGRWIILVSTIAGLMLAGLYTFLSGPVYEATTLVQIESSTRGGTSRTFDLTGSGVSTKLTNELEVLKSDGLKEGVARALIKKRTVDAEHLRPIRMILGNVATGDSFQVASVPEIVKRLTKAVDFTPTKESDIIRISARSSNPEEAALIANVYTQTYADRNVSASRQKSRELRDFLQSQLTAKHAQLDSTEHRLQEYMQESGVVSLDDEAKKRVEQMAQLESTRDALDIDISSREKALSSLKEQLLREEPNVARAMGESNDAYVKLLQEQIAQLEVQRDVALTQAAQKGGEAVQVFKNQFRDIDLQIDQLKKNLRDRADKLVGNLLPSEQRGGSSDVSGAFVASAKQKIIEQTIELEGLKAKKTALTTVIHDAERQFNQIPAKSIELAKLQRARLSTEKLYLLVEEKYNEAAITETSDFGSVNIVDPAITPYEPVAPRPGLYLMVGFFLGLGIGVSIVFVRASLDTRLRTPEDLKRLGIAPLAVIHWVDKKLLAAMKAEEQSGNGKPFHPTLIMYHNPFAPVSETYRHLRTSMQDEIEKQSLKVVMLTSGRPQEGKSTVTANLAVAFAQNGQRVLLIDADLRRPAIHGIFGMTDQPGLTDVLLRQAALQACVHRSVLEDLDILCSGHAVPNPAELLGSAVMKEMVKETRPLYDIVLLDCAPLLPVADAGVLAHWVDGTVLVVQSGFTTIEMLEHAEEFLTTQHHNVLGLVLNGFDAIKSYGTAHFAYNSGYAYYGNYNPADGGREPKNP
jgi:capsular exopolysaccharide synthesis family protein